MATAEMHQTPEWETPVPKKDLFSRLKSNPLSTFTSSTPTTKPESLKEIPAETTTTETGSAKRTFSDKWLPHWLSCMGRSRKNFFCSMAALLLLIILVLGLALGLGLSHKSWVNLNSFHPGVIPRFV
jgi:hypothetical protein